MGGTPYSGGACACVKEWTLRGQSTPAMRLRCLPRARVTGGKRADGRCEVRSRTGGREARLPAVSALSSPHRRSTSATNRVAATRAKAGDERESASKALAIFVSGGGSNLKRLYEATQDGRIASHVALVVSDKPGCGGWTFAEDLGISTLHFPPKRGEEGVSAAELVTQMQRLDVDYVLLAGYLKLIPAEVVKAFPQAVLNIHPALLPAFGGKGYYGMNVHRAVVASGARVSGPTVHFIDEEYDKGTIIAQRPVPVYPTDTPEDVAARVLQQEWILFAEVVGQLCRGDYQWRSDGVIMLRSPSADGPEYV